MSDRVRVSTPRFFGMFAASFLLLFAVVAIGCTQDTNQGVKQDAAQTTNTPTKTQQDTATQGSQIYVTQNFWNAPERKDECQSWDEGGPVPADPIKVPVTETLALADASTTRDSQTVKGATGRFNQAGNGVIYLQTGGTTPTVTGSATGSGSASQIPGQTGSQDARQRIDPNTTAAAQFAMPGSAPSQQASTAGQGSTSSPTQSNAQTAEYLQLKADKETLQKYISLLEKMKGPPSTQPADDAATPSLLLPQNIPTP